MPHTCLKYASYCTAVVIKPAYVVPSLCPHILTLLVSFPVVSYPSLAHSAAASFSHSTQSTHLGPTDILSIRLNKPALPPASSPTLHPTQRFCTPSQPHPVHYYLTPDRHAMAFRSAHSRIWPNLPTISLLVLASFLSFVPAAFSRDALTFDNCKLSDDCLEPRLCIGLDDGVLVLCDLTNLSNCICAPPAEFDPCVSSSDCTASGEGCFDSSDAPNPFCVSCEAAGDFDNLEALDDRCTGTLRPSLSPPPSSTPSPFPILKPSPRPGLSLDECSLDADCVRPRTCISADSTDGQPCEPASANCLCLPFNLQSCANSQECVEGEGCVTIEEASDGFCSSCAVASRFTEIDNGCSIPGGPPRTPPPSASPSPSPRPPGLTGEMCRVSAQCAELRRCGTLRGAEILPCSRITDRCACFQPNGFDLCGRSADCVSGGERCVRSDSTLSSFCVSCIAFPGLAGVTALDGGCENRAPNPFPLPPPGRRGRTCEACGQSADCVGRRECLAGRDGGFRVCGLGEGAVCTFRDQRQCSNSTDCKTAGEGCATRVNNIGADLEKQFCVSCAVLSVNPALRALDEGCGGFQLAPSPASPLPNTSTSARPSASVGPTQNADESDDAKESGEPEESAELIEASAEPSSEGELPEETAEVSESPSTATPPLPPSAKSSPSSAGGSKLTFEFCQRNSECAGERKCILAGNESLQECTAKTGNDVACFCLPPQLLACTRSAECVERGERCVALDMNQLCVSCVIEEQTREQGIFEALDDAECEVAERR